MLDELTKKTEGKILKYFDKFNKVVDVGQSLKEVSSVNLAVTLIENKFPSAS